ncbi:972_t:CDS:1, partial [Funneliformis mosseae]
YKSRTRLNTRPICRSEIPAKSEINRIIVDPRLWQFNCAILDLQYFAEFYHGISDYLFQNIEHASK